MKILAAIALAAAVGCGTIEPFLKPIASCAGKQVTTADVDEAFADLVAKDWADLAIEAGRLGWDTVSCIIDQLEVQHAELKPNAAEFKSLHAAELGK